MKSVDLSLAFALALACSACSDMEASAVTGSGTGGGGTGGATGAGGGSLGKGVGESCTGTADCRSGLACESGACAPGHTLEEGSPCTISGECLDGLFCGSGFCVPGGTGEDGASCSSDADCASGFRCALVGLGAQCQPEGTGDVGGACGTSVDCFGGLACLSGVCGVTPPGTPPFGLPWPGVECPAESGPVQAYFRVPRGTDDGDFYRLPHPNDVRLIAGKPDLTGHPRPGPALLGYDVVDRYLRSVEAGNDGWGLYHSTFFRFSGALDSDTFMGNVKLVNLTTGGNMGLYYGYSTGGGAYICPNWVAIRRAPGAVYDQGSTYAAYMLTGLKAAGGAPITRSADLDALLAAAAPSDPILAAEYPKYASFRAYLATNAIDPATVLNATVFTTGTPRATIEKLQAAIGAGAAPVATQWTKCDVGTVSPCPDATGERACPATPDPDFDELHALVALPIYQSGTPPYLQPVDGGDIHLVAGNPTVVRTEQVCMSLTVPKSAPPGPGFPTVVYAHGTGGSFRSHVIGGLAKDFANGVDDGKGNVVAAAMLGIDQVQHGPRRGASTASPNDLFFNFANPAAARGNPRQGAADQMSLLAFVPTVTFTSGTSPTGAAFSLAPSPAYWGHSQGATEGGLAIPWNSAWSGAVFSGQGGSLTDALLTKTSPVDIAAVVPFVLSDFSSTGTLRGGTNHPVLSVLQTWIDGADPVTYGRLVSKAPPTGIAAHHVFQPYGLGDTFSPPATEQAYALSAAFGLVAHDASVTTPDDIGGLTEIPTPAQGNMTTAGKVVTAVVRQYAPASGNDGHFVAFDVPSARADVERFLAGALSGVGQPQVGP